MDSLAGPLCKRYAVTHSDPKAGIGLPQNVGIRFQVLFHSPTGVLFTIFARATGSLSVAEEYLALEGGPSGFRPGFTCPTLLGYPIGSVVVFRLRGYHPLRLSFQCDSTRRDVVNSRRRPESSVMGPTTPRAQRLWAYMHWVWAPSRSLAAT
jgi:hypothetical protein